MRAEKHSSNVSLDGILEDFDPRESATKSTLTGGTTVTIWLSPEDKARYSKLQARTGRRFSKIAREILLAAMASAEKKAS